MRKYRGFKDKKEYWENIEDSRKRVLNVSVFDLIEKCKNKEYDVPSKINIYEMEKWL